MNGTTSHASHTPAMAAVTATGRLAASAVVAAAALIMLLRLGAVLPAPPLRAPGALGTWVEAQGLGRTAMMLLRLCGVALAGYLTATTTAATLAAAARLPRLFWFADLVSGGLVQRLAGGALTGVISSAAFASLPVGAAPGPAPTPVTMHLVLETTTAATPAASPAPTMHLLIEEDQVATELPTVATMTPTHDAPAVWTIQPGDHLWAIAEATVTRATGPTPATDVAEYWLELVAHNRARLADPSNPDLLFVGQVIELPPPA